MKIIEWPTVLDLGESWHEILKEELQLPYFVKLLNFLEKERSSGVSIYPPENLVFHAFKQTAFEDVRVVIVGQDPYHGPGQAHGLSFSVPEGVSFPPSLQNIFKELKNDIGLPIPSHGCLDSWAQQGVLLLNATLTVRCGEPLSHHQRGWELFTDAVITRLVERLDPIIFVLWGKFAQQKCQRINLVERLSNGEPFSHHFILCAAHPSPFSAYRGFFGCHHFSAINQLLVKVNKKPIDWSAILPKVLN